MSSCVDFNPVMLRRVMILMTLKQNKKTVSYLQTDGLIVIHKGAPLQKSNYHPEHIRSWGLDPSPKVIVHGSNQMPKKRWDFTGFLGMSSGYNSETLSIPAAALQYLKALFPVFSGFFFLSTLGKPQKKFFKQV